MMTRFGRSQSRPAATKPVTSLFEQKPKAAAYEPSLSADLFLIYNRELAAILRQPFGRLIPEVIPLGR
jgi:hypothetical protein